MKATVLSLWESVHTSFRFLPALIAVVAVGLSYGMVRLDRAVSLDARRPGDLFYPGGPEGARWVLSTIAGSVITVAGVTFSITIAALTMASSPFGPRLLWSFMADKGNQVVLGTFVGTFIYCLLVLRTIIDNNTSGEFVPKIAVTFGIVLALASFAVLIYFFHHASSSIQAEQILLDVAEQHTVQISEMGEDALREMERRFFVRVENLRPRVYYRLTDNWLELTVRFICRSHGIRDLKDALSRGIIERLEDAGIPLASTTVDVVGLPPLRVRMQDQAESA